ncbi:hypothetical protein EV401DRAFT_1901532 [Pisolithus croceorrhizus]|nr:hypothetical protein EV401DRAFT_1901532 [Pisolithus croceorrhizus]
MAESVRALGARHSVRIYSMCQEQSHHSPQFKALLIHGAYPQSVPIHVSLSVAQCERALLISPSRQSLIRDLGSCDDGWLRSSSGLGTISSISSRVRIFYPPTPKHVVALLSLLRCRDDDNATDATEPKVTVDSAPSLLILHEPSAYFLDDQIQCASTLSSYLLLVAHARAIAEYFSSRKSNPARSTSLLVFDSRLDQLKLPLFRAPSELAFDAQQERDNNLRPEAVLPAAKRYFDKVGTFQELRGTLPEIFEQPFQSNYKS